MAWDEDKKAKAVDMYVESEPTPENSMDIVAEIAEELDESVNGVRMILSKAGVYVKKAAAPAKSSGGSASKSGGGTRVSKEDAQNALREAIEAAGAEVDEDIVSKLTGKAATYFVAVLSGKSAD